MTYHLGTNGETPSGRLYGYWKISDLGQYPRLRELGLPDLVIPGSGPTGTGRLSELLRQGFPVVYLGITATPGMAETSVNIRYMQRQQAGGLWEVRGGTFSPTAQETEQIRRLLMNTALPSLQTADADVVSRHFTLRMAAEDNRDDGGGTGLYIGLGVAAAAVAALVFWPRNR